MAINFPFDYIDSFSEPTQRSMPEILRISGENDPEILLILRLLSGAIKFKHKKYSSVITQKENYFSSDFRGYSSKWSNKFPKLIYDECDSNYLAEYIEKTKFKNRGFYKGFLCELSNFYYYKNNGSHTTAFLYLYRALEYISYAFPLIYVSKTDDFFKTFSYLKDLMRESKESGEIGFFKVFINKLYDGDAIKDSSIDFLMALDTVDEQLQIFNILHNNCKADMIGDSTDSPRTLSINYTEVGSFIITIRNRFFHYKNGETKNIDSYEIIDSDILFSLINKQCMYWLATVFLGVLSHNIQEVRRSN